jgi:hypothetical protein
MPDERHHRGPHPEDADLFATRAEAALRSAVADLSWLLSRAYATPGALKLVGDRYGLSARQRTAVMRSSCSDEALAQRARRRVDGATLAGQRLLIDGYNVLTTVEAALAGGVILAARDGCFRDMASMHGTWRQVEETCRALELIGRFLVGIPTGPCVWYLDSPVSNSGRLKVQIQELAATHGWGWQVEVVINPDAVLSASQEIVASADSVVLDRCQRWYGLAQEVVLASVPAAHILHLG